MKRKVLFMTLAMAVVLTACGGNADKEASSNTETNVSEDAGAADDGAEQQPLLHAGPSFFTQATRPVSSRVSKKASR